MGQIPKKRRISLRIGVYKKAFWLTDTFTVMLINVQLHLKKDIQQKGVQARYITGMLKITYALQVLPSAHNMSLSYVQDNNLCLRQIR